MNIVVANKYKSLIDGANIEILKELNGVFKVSDIVNSFNSIFYKKLIIDATALSNFPKDEVIRELVSRFDTDKLILFLPPDNPPPMKFLSFLVSNNLYNFTDNIKGLKELIRKSNTYDDVREFVSVQPSSNKQSELDLELNYSNNFNNKIILGIKNVTKDSTSTSLVYMLKKVLEEVHKKKVIALEIDKRDFLFYNSKDMYSIESSKLSELLKNDISSDVILIDLDNNQSGNMCSDVIYLIDPSLYRINELLFTDRNAFNELKGKKVVLNNSLLNDNDVNIFAKEAGISIYFNLPPLNDRIYNPILNNLLAKLGIVSSEVEKTKKGLFDLFK